MSYSDYQVECPYCEAENGINDIWECGNSFEHECEECGEIFDIEIEYDPSLSASKIDWKICDLCKSKVKDLTDSSLFTQVKPHLDGMKICDSCIRAELGYR